MTETDAICIFERWTEEQDPDHCIFKQNEWDDCIATIKDGESNGKHIFHLMMTFVVRNFLQKTLKSDKHDKETAEAKMIEWTHELANTGFESELRKSENKCKLIESKIGGWLHSNPVPDAFKNEKAVAALAEITLISISVFSSMQKHLTSEKNVMGKHGFEKYDLFSVFKKRLKKKKMTGIFNEKWDAFKQQQEPDFGRLCECFIITILAGAIKNQRNRVYGYQQLYDVIHSHTDDVESMSNSDFRAVGGSDGRSSNAGGSRFAPY
jgi:hypothetical protein